MTSADEIAVRLKDRVRSRRWGLAVAVASGQDEGIVFDSGDDALDAATLFEIGSITKSMTAVLLADVVVRGEAALTTTLGEVLPVAGRASRVTLRDLATHRSGLPRLPPRLLEDAHPDDPYAHFGEPELAIALGEVEPPQSGDVLYSNFGFMVLGHALATITSTPFELLIAERLFAPLGMSSAMCARPSSAAAVGYDGNRPVTWWAQPLAGAGGVGATIVDLLCYLRAHIEPPSGPLGEAIMLATPEEPPPEGLGWVHQGGGWLHDGRTAGFSSFIGFYRPARAGVAMLANGGGVSLAHSGIQALTAMARTPA